MDVRHCVTIEDDSKLKKKLITSRINRDTPASFQMQQKRPEILLSTVSDYPMFLSYISWMQTSKIAKNSFSVVPTHYERWMQ